DETTGVPDVGAWDLRQHLLQPRSQQVVEQRRQRALQLALAATGRFVVAVRDLRAPGEARELRRDGVVWKLGEGRQDIVAVTQAEAKLGLPDRELDPQPLGAGHRLFRGRVDAAGLREDHL